MQCEENTDKGIKYGSKQDGLSRSFCYTKESMRDK